MKKFFLIILLISAIGPGRSGAQSAYYDAMTLKGKYVQAMKKIVLSDDVSKILAPYYKVDANRIDTVFVNQNPFFNGLFIEGGVMSVASSGLPGIAAIGDLDVTNFADGLAKFLVERSKEELNVAFFSKFRDYLKSYPEIKIVFPTTYEFLSQINSYQYAAMLPALKAAFQKDLNDFSTNLLKLRDISAYEGYETDNTIKARADQIIQFLNTLQGRSVCAAILVAKGIMKGNNAAEIIDDLNSDQICVPDDNFSNVIGFAELVSTSLRSKDEGRIWVTKKQVRELVNDDIALRLWFGLIYAKDHSATRQVRFTLDGKTVSLNDLLTKLSANWKTDAGQAFRQSFASAALSMSAAADNAANVQDAKDKGVQPSILVYADYASSVADMLKEVAGFLAKNPGLDPRLAKLSSDVATFAAVIHNATDACYDVKSQNYGALVLHTSALLTGILGDDFKYKDEFIKYGTFMANIVEAKNSDEVKAAIDAAVLPVGSSSIKRETTLNISLNAFIGPYAGAEFLPALKKDPWAFSLGVTAPVGVAFSWGKIGQGKVRSSGRVSGGKSFSIFIPLIDVGALASFRLGSDSSQVASQVKLANILAPGLYFYYGFGKCPVSVGLGAQLGPQLRNVTATEVNIDKNYYLRFGFNIVVDIPFFNLYTKN